ncbi:hypothetical protein EHS11_04600 [Leptospira ilyithenensis]|uniref:Uncharacterized protein n=1 Tax=Leptospira ilyithenensis TaxID=2484901 RepID=A0A4R9LSX0_9LEPT|nr:hypothetical protein EHS11_04600 [Leptospira ilyithenensis]
MKLKFFLLTAIFFSFSTFKNTRADELPRVPVQTFAAEEGLIPEDIASFPELKTWALYQFYELEPDNPTMGIQDYLCRMVPETGLRFLLEKSPKNRSTVYLYLDMTRYLPQKKAIFKSRKLDIYINRRKKKEIYTSRGKSFTNPVEIQIEPNEFPDGKIYVELFPSTSESGRFWGVWDAFILENPLEKN